MASLDDLYVARRLLEDWARWLNCGGGYAHQSSIEQFQSGWGISSGAFVSRLPIDVEPSISVLMTIRAVQHLRALDGRAAELLARIYLEHTPMLELSERDEVSLSQMQGRRRGAERSFYCLFGELQQRVSAQQ